jgi:hypothetical protein
MHLVEAHRIVENQDLEEGHHTVVDLAENRDLEEALRIQAEDLKEEDRQLRILTCSYPYLAYLVDHPYPLKLMHYLVVDLHMHLVVAHRIVADPAAAIVDLDLVDFDHIEVDFQVVIEVDHIQVEDLKEVANHLQILTCSYPFQACRVPCSYPLILNHFVVDHHMRLVVVLRIVEMKHLMDSK